MKKSPVETTSDPTKDTKVTVNSNFSHLAPVAPPRMKRISKVSVEDNMQEIDLKSDSLA